MLGYPNNTMQIKCKGESQISQRLSSSQRGWSVGGEQLPQKERPLRESGKWEGEQSIKTQMEHQGEGPQYQGRKRSPWETHALRYFCKKKKEYFRKVRYELKMSYDAIIEMC